MLRVDLKPPHLSRYINHGNYGIWPLDKVFFVVLYLRLILFLIFRVTSFFPNLYLLLIMFACLFVVIQLYGSQIILQQKHVVPVRSFAKEAAPPVLKGDGG